MSAKIWHHVRANDSEMVGEVWETTFIKQDCTSGNKRRTDELKQLRQENKSLKVVYAELTLEHKCSGKVI
jgi:hypothetical protein